MHQKQLFCFKTVYFYTYFIEVFCCVKLLLSQEDNFFSVYRILCRRGQVEAVEHGEAYERKMKGIHNLELITETNTYAAA